MLTGTILFVSFNFHFLLMIISLEFIMLAITLTFVLLNSSTSGIYYFMLFLVTMVCMGSYGVTLIIYLYRTTGTDKFFD